MVDARVEQDVATQEIMIPVRKYYFFVAGFAEQVEMEDGESESFLFVTLLGLQCNEVTRFVFGHRLKRLFSEGMSYPSRLMSHDHTGAIQT